MKPNRQASPRFHARVAGALYLTSIVARIAADGFVRDRLVVSSDSAATAANILAHQGLFRFGFIADMVSFASYVALAALLYNLFEPVNRNLSLVAAFFGVASAITQALSSVFHLAALFVLGGSEYLRVFTVEQLQALALILLKLRAIAYHNVGLVFLGFYCLLIGYLIIRSTFLPRFVGVLTALAGLAYFAFLSPPLAGSLLPYLLIPAGVGQITLTLWLLVIGVNGERWAEQT